MWIQNIVYLLIFSNFGHSDTIKFPQPYQFGYTVSDKTTGDFKSHQEVNDGKEVRGRYSLVEPTGDLRVVTYTADKTNGFRAVVNVEPRTQTQPTPIYHLVKLPPQQNLRRQHAESTDTTVTRKEDLRPGEQENREERRNNTESEQMMAVVKDITTQDQDKHISQSEYKLENRGEVFDKNTFNTEHLNSGGPQIIPVKVEEDTLGIGSEVQEPVLKVEMTSIKSDIIEEMENLNTTQNKTTQKTDDQNNKKVSTPSPQIKIENSDDQTNVYSSQINNNPDKENVIKSMVELHYSSTDKQQPTLQPSLENVFTTLGYFKTSQYQPLQTKNPDVIQITTSKTKDDKDIQEKSKNNTIRVTSNNEGTKMAEMNQNNMMLAALLLPTTPILKFTCTPDHYDQNKMEIKPTIPQNAPMTSQRSPQPISLGPGGSIFPPSIPLLPFQIVNFSPMKQIFTPPQNNKFTAQKPFSFLSTKPPFVTGLLQNKETTVTVAPQHNTNTPHKDDDSLVKAKPPNSYTNLRTEGSASQAHKVQSSLYMHHLLPPPWAPHPLRLTHNSHYRHMPIFVLPMSHNLNFAPTFDPAMIEQHNH